MIPVNDNQGGIGALSANPCLLTPCAGMTFALPIAQIDDVFAAPPITPVPLAPRDVAGLLNMRGRILTALCLAVRLGLPPPPDRTQALVIGVTHAHEAFGLLVPAVGEVVPLPPEGREPVPPHLRAAWTACARALHQTPGGLVIELDLAALLTLSGDCAAA